MDENDSLMTFNDLIHCIGLDATPFQLEKSIFHPISDVNYAYFEYGTLPLRWPLDFLPAGMYGLSEQDVQNGIFFLNTNILNLFNPTIQLIDGNYIDGHNFFKPYIIGYNSGKAAFKEYYAINSSNDRISNSNVDNIKHAFTEMDPFTGEKENRWSNWLHKYPEKISHCEIAFHGFYCALYYATIELRSMYPIQFRELRENGAFENEQDESIELNEDIEKLVMLYKTGVINHLRETYPEINKRPIKLSILLAGIIGLNKDTEIARWKTFKSNVGHLYGATPEVVLREKHLRKINADLASLGL